MALWRDFRDYVKSQGMDICRVLFSMIEAYMKGMAEVKAPGQTTIINQTNHFYYQVAKARREPEIGKAHAKKLRRVAIEREFSEAHALKRARELAEKGIGFTYLDLWAIDYETARKCINMLKKRGK
jgi:hypothetical protein